MSPKVRASGCLLLVLAILAAIFLNRWFPLSVSIIDVIPDEFSLDTTPHAEPTIAISAASPDLIA